MAPRKIWLYSLLIVTLSTVTLLMTGSSILTYPLDNSNSIPLGTFITWAGMISLPLGIYFGVKEFRKPSENLTKFLAVLLKATFLLALLWVPISYLLAGNIAFTFSEKETFQGGQTAMKWFWALSYSIGIGAIGTLCIYWISRSFKRI